MTMDCPPPVVQGDAVKGKAIYEGQCLACHGADGTSDAFAVMIPLKTVYSNGRSLVQYNHDTMPLTNPKNCENECAVDVSAYAQELNKAYLAANATPVAMAGFPLKLAVSSPLAGTEVVVTAPAQQKTRAITDVEALLGAVMATPSSLASYLDVAGFFQNAHNAQDCYGPTLDYAEHPDGTAGNSGQLPSGDLGIWAETMPDTDNDGIAEACAAAQLNAQMEAVESRTTMALAVLAAMRATYEATGSADISADLPMGVTASDMTISVTEHESSAVTTYGITLTADYNVDGTDEVVTVQLQHDQDAANDDIYEGLLTLQIADSFMGGNCGSGLNDVTRYTSVHYLKNAASDLRLQSREAQFCGSSAADVASHAAFSEAVAQQSANISGYVLSPSATWADNFSVFTAAYDPTTANGEIEGRYTYTWQAGNGDSHARVLDVGIDVTAGGEAWFGYGQRVQDVAGVNEFGIIGGFICNWAGPNANHTLMDYAQRQHLTLNADAGIYTVNANGSSSNITYAPTNSCEYDGAGLFVYDRDLDGDLANETTDTLVVASGAALTLDLLAVDHPGDFTASVDSTNDIPDIWEVITNARNFQLPAYPVAPAP